MQSKYLIGLLIQFVYIICRQSELKQHLLNVRLYGGYKNLEGGFTNNALVDFTGGISEMISLKKSNLSNLYDELYEMMKRSSMLGGHIDVIVLLFMSSCLFHNQK